MRSWNRVVVAGLVGAVLIAVAGCTGTDTLNSGNGVVSFSFEGTNTASHFTDEPGNDIAVINFSNIYARPVSTTADAALYSQAITLFPASGAGVDVNFASDFETAPPITLPSGSYEVTEVQLRQVAFIDAQTPTSGATCKERAKRFSLLTAGIPIPASLISGSPIFSTSTDTGQPLTIVVDVDAFLDALVASSSDCTPPTCSCTAYDTATLGGLASTYLSFN